MIIFKTWLSISHKKPRLQPLSKRYIFGKTVEENLPPLFKSCKDFLWSWKPKLEFCPNLLSHDSWWWVELSCVLKRCKKYFITIFKAFEFSRITCHHQNHKKVFHALYLFRDEGLYHNAEQINGLPLYDRDLPHEIVKLYNLYLRYASELLTAIGLEPRTT